jgi:hypothetical protein
MKGLDGFPIPVLWPEREGERGRGREKREEFVMVDLWARLWNGLERASEQSAKRRRFLACQPPRRA